MMLQAALPFKSKPKDKAKQMKQTLEQRRAVVQSLEDRKAVSLVQQLSAIRNQREVKRKEAQQKRNEVNFLNSCSLTSPPSQHFLARCQRHPEQHTLFLL